jgi:hypothetical protein
MLSGGVRMFEIEGQGGNGRKENADVALVGLAEFPGLAEQVLAGADLNHNGQVTKNELANALENPGFKGKNAQALAALYQNFDDLCNLAIHESGSSRHALTGADLRACAGIVEKHLNTQSMEKWARANLNFFDANSNGSLSRAEIAAALKNQNICRADRQALEQIAGKYSSLGHFWESGVNVRAINDYAAGICRDSENARLVSGVFNSCLNVNSGQKSEVSHSLYADSRQPVKSITPEAIKQGSIGDCYFEASLASVAAARPYLIKNAISDNQDGTFTVTFAGHKRNPVTVKAPTEAEQGLYNHGSSEGLWASVMEKAYGEYCRQHFWRRNIANLSGGYTPSEGADGGGKTAGVMKLLTGRDVSVVPTYSTEPSAMAARLEAALAQKAPAAVTAAIHDDGMGSGSCSTVDNFYKRHAYSITAFAPDGHGGGLVTVRNPWGGREGTTAGKISIPLAKFMQNFSEVTIEK